MLLARDLVEGLLDLEIVFLLGLLVPLETELGELLGGLGALTIGQCGGRNNVAPSRLRWSRLDVDAIEIELGRDARHGLAHLRGAETKRTAAAARLKGRGTP